MTFDYALSLFSDYYFVFWAALIEPLYLVRQLLFVSH